MDEQRHRLIELLAKGREAWNSWRRETRGTIYVDLPEANLADAKLAGFSLRAVNLVGSNLKRASLDGADLERADLGGVNLDGASLLSARLSGANLTRASLVGADLSAADLTRAFLLDADLRDADLGDVNLNGAVLRRATMEGAIFWETVFANVDLSGAVGLDQCKHWGPSSIDFQTFAKSGDLPRSFLRAIGQPDVLIDYLPSLLAEPLHFQSCFISYSTKDGDFVQKLHEHLQSCGVRCWYAPNDLKTGEKMRPAIDRAIHSYDKLLLVLSQNSIKSDWVESEVETALERERNEGRVILFPVRLDDAVMEIPSGWPANVRRSRSIGDFRNWQAPQVYQRAFSRLLHDLSVGTSRP
jgi:hypothetical protein